VERPAQAGRSRRAGRPAPSALATSERTTGTRLDLVLIARHPGMSRRKAKDVIEKGQVAVAGQIVCEPGRLVLAQESVLWDPHRRALRRARLDLARLFEDEHVLIVDKPAGLLSVPTAGADPESEDTALGRVTEYVRHLRPRRPYVGRVHRLDRETSGALAFALSAAARRGLLALFHDHRIERVYLALVRGAPGAAAGRIDLPIRDTYVGGRRGVAHPGEAASPALSRWRVRERFAQATLLEVRIETGRQHQVRAHLAHVGLPIVGDAVYGDTRALGRGIMASRVMLHAWRLSFQHPLSGVVVAAESPVPEDLADLLKKLGDSGGGRANGPPPRP
jgi:23S rRNA pseudouridine1911/1915/1917 synthase